MDREHGRSGAADWRARARALLLGGVALAGLACAVLGVLLSQLRRFIYQVRLEEAAVIVHDLARVAQFAEEERLERERPWPPCAWEPDAQIGPKTRPLRDLRIGDEAFRPNEPVRCSYSLCEVDGELWALGACDPDEDGVVTFFLQSVGTGQDPTMPPTTDGVAGSRREMEMRTPGEAGDLRGLPPEDVVRRWVEMGGGR